VDDNLGLQGTAGREEEDIYPPIRRDFHRFRKEEQVKRILRESDRERMRRSPPEICPDPNVKCQDPAPLPSYFFS
jgi:hypothetical protein